MGLEDILDDDVYDNKLNNLSDDANTLQNPLASANSMRVALEFLNRGKSGLNRHCQNLLSRVPESYEWARLQRDSVSFEDLAYLSAATDDEFALLRGRSEDIIYHGDHMTCPIDKDETLMFLCKSHKVRLEAHTHNDVGQIVPSLGDKNFLREIGQKESVIISYVTGKTFTFTSDII